MYYADGYRYAYIKLERTHQSTLWIPSHMLLCLRAHTSSAQCHTPQFPGVAQRFHVDLNLNFSFLCSSVSLAIGISRLTALSPSCLQSRCCQHSVGMWGGLPCVLPFWGALSVSVSGVTAWGRHGVGWGTWCQAPFSRCGVLSPFQSRQMACSGPRV